MDFNFYFIGAKEAETEEYEIINDLLADQIMSSHTLNVKYEFRYDNEPSGSEGANNTYVPDPSSDQTLEEPGPSIIFSERESIFLHQVEDSNVDEQNGVADENEKMMAPPAKKNQAS
ncbi:hypothetical protein WA026_023071 [Henosepilachna vigintioctopunctata]|uniref:Uncharacterized protein n=1 Tax=Henosepilachna vigintioctopunctata TaxID=420089 RepID=A0AAW1V224_9CUCU